MYLQTNTLEPQNQSPWTGLTPVGSTLAMWEVELELEDDESEAGRDKL
jgi:hypothetical protein